MRGAAAVWALVGWRANVGKTLNNNDHNQVFWARETEHPQQTIVLTKTAGQQPGSGHCCLRSSQMLTRKPRFRELWNKHRWNEGYFVLQVACNGKIFISLQVLVSRQVTFQFSYVPALTVSGVSTNPCTLWICSSPDSGTSGPMTVFPLLPIITNKERKMHESSISIFGLKRGGRRRRSEVISLPPRGFLGLIYNAFCAGHFGLLVTQFTIYLRSERYPRPD